LPRRLLSFPGKKAKPARLSQKNKNATSKNTRHPQKLSSKRERGKERVEGEKKDKRKK
jgi:hypothetical protein